MYDKELGRKDAARLKQILRAADEQTAATKVFVELTLMIADKYKLSRIGTLKTATEYLIGALVEECKNSRTANPNKTADNSGTANQKIT